MIKLIGILIVALGFALRFNTLLVVMAAGIGTGLVAGMSFDEIMILFGKYFVENRYITLIVLLMLPVVGLLERYGLRERAEMLIRQAKAATAGRVLLLYTALRQVSIALGVNIGGHAVMVRPLVAPMAEAAGKMQIKNSSSLSEADAKMRAKNAALTAEAPGKMPTSRVALGVGAAAQMQPTQSVPDVGDELSEQTVQAIRAHAAAAENVGNFFGEDTIFAVGAVYLIKGVLETAGQRVGVWALSLWGIPTALVAFGVMAWRTRVLDRRITRGASRGKMDPKP